MPVGIGYKGGMGAKKAISTAKKTAAASKKATAKGLKGSRR